ncbi:hypothetical protein OROGR_031462 [Orobanche gracilis]
MATFASFLSCSSSLSPSPLPSLGSSLRRYVLPSSSFSVFSPSNFFGKLQHRETQISASSDSSSFGWDFITRDGKSPSKKSTLFNLVGDIEPLDVSLIQKDVPQTTIDAMKRTVSGMLGLLPSDQFQVIIEALWEPLSKLLISSMMTGCLHDSKVSLLAAFILFRYTLRNAEYRLSLERNLEIYVGENDKSKTEDPKLEAEGTHPKGNNTRRNFRQERLPTYDIPDFGEMTHEARQYILKLHSRLSSVKNELHEVKRKSAALQMQQFVGEEKNDLLDYLRSLQPEKVAELSEPTLPELKDTIHSVVHGLLATLSPKMHSKGPDLVDNSTAGIVDGEIEGDCIDLVENTSLQFQPFISLPRDYLARLLFWCMLLGHYLRGLEYRLELMELLSLPCVADNDSANGELAF